MTEPSMVDWDLAVRVGSRLAGDGPQIPRAEADACVAELREHANASTSLVREFTGLVAQDRSAPVLVVDRPGWIRANADGFDKLMTPVFEKLQEKKGRPSALTASPGTVRPVPSGRG